MLENRFEKQKNKIYKRIPEKTETFMFLCSISLQFCLDLLTCPVCWARAEFSLFPYKTAYSTS